MYFCSLFDILGAKKDVLNVRMGDTMKNQYIVRSNVADRPVASSMVVNTRILEKTNVERPVRSSGTNWRSKL